MAARWWPRHRRADGGGPGPRAGARPHGRLARRQHHGARRARHPDRRPHGQRAQPGRRHRPPPRHRHRVRRRHARRGDRRPARAAPRRARRPGAGRRARRRRAGARARGAGPTRRRAHRACGPAPAGPELARAAFDGVACAALDAIDQVTDAGGALGRGRAAPAHRAGTRASRPTRRCWPPSPTAPWRRRRPDRWLPPGPASRPPPCWPSRPPQQVAEAWDLGAGDWVDPEDDPDAPGPPPGPRRGAQPPAPGALDPAEPHGRAGLRTAGDDRGRHRCGASWRWPWAKMTITAEATARHRAPDQLLGLAVERAYGAFARNRLGRSMVVRRADVTPADVAALSGPVRSVPAAAIDRWLPHAVTTWGTAEDLRALLPRVFELLTAGLLDTPPEVLFAKLRHADASGVARRRAAGPRGRARRALADHASRRTHRRSASPPGDVLAALAELGQRAQPAARTTGCLLLTSGAPQARPRLGSTCKPSSIGWPSSERRARGRRPLLVAATRRRQRAWRSGCRRR